MHGFTQLFKTFSFSATSQLIPTPTPPLLSKSSQLYSPILQNSHPCPMLKLLSSSHKPHHHFASTPCLPVATESPTSPLLKALSSITELTGGKHGWYQKAFFYSDSSSSDKGKPVEVLALPLPDRPLFPGFFMPISVKDPKLMAALQESWKWKWPAIFAGAFLLKDEPGTDPSVVSGSESEKNISDVRGKELLNRLHKVGTLAQIISFEGDEVFLIGHGRLQITEMVGDEYPLTVKVDHLKDKPSNKGRDDIKAALSSLTSVLERNSLWRERVPTYTLRIAKFSVSTLADFGAGVSTANKLKCQKVLEELDVDKRLELTLELVKKEMEISKIQVEPEQT